MFAPELLQQLRREKREEGRRPARRRGLVVGKKLWPGQDGTKKLQERFGEDLYCVRYLYDEENQVRYTTVELILEQAPRKVRERHPRDSEWVEIALEYEEAALRRRVK